MDIRQSRYLTYGVIVPMVNTAAEARAAVEAARYAPQGNRSVGGQLHAANFNTAPGTYYEKANDEIFVAVMTEHVDSIANLEEIARVPGIEGRTWNVPAIDNGILLVRNASEMAAFDVGAP